MLAGGQTLARPPLAWYGPTVLQRAAIERAVQLDASICMLHRGLSYQPRTPSIQQRLAEERQLLERRYGITNRTEAATHGYLPAPITALAPGMNDGTATAGQLPRHVATALIGDSAHSGCLSRAQDRIGLTAHGHSLLTTAEALGNAAWLAARQNPDVRVVIAAWVGCMARAGYQVDDPLNSGIPPNRAAAGPAEIAQALADIDCKARTDLVDQWQGAEVTAAARIEAQHHGELNRARQRTRIAVARACSRLVGDSTYSQMCGRPGRQPLPVTVR